MLTIRRNENHSLTLPMNTQVNNTMPNRWQSVGDRKEGKRKKTKPKTEKSQTKEKGKRKKKVRKNQNNNPASS